MTYFTPEEIKKLRDAGAMAFPGESLPVRRSIVTPPPAPAPKAVPERIEKDLERYNVLVDLINQTLEALAVAMELDRDAMIAAFVSGGASATGIKTGFNRAIEMVRAAKKP